ncbi:PREDICTED: cyclin-J18-like isoform X2 [Nelumbo nucifera]|uniref:Cyclin-J18-like isoform X2 n=1 Tax=Nelumbo nucifera TaxID=4432 RepID=A0A1U8B5M4_NELNU|nr:PREDICTED: cyclin-J18-like isoform X2 [Nelumbo nucifera]
MLSGSTLLLTSCGSRKARFMRDNSKRNWLLQPFRESNMQLFALISLWISSKIHESCPLSVKSLKSLGDEIIGEQHFTIRDFLESEVVFMQVLDFEIGVSNIAFLFLEDLLIQFRELARVGELVNFETCMNIMDLLYETEETSSLYASPCSLAASILVASYVITVPKQQWEFPLLPWVKFVTSYKEESIEKLVRTILEHVLKDHLLEKKSVLEEKV